MLQLFQQQQAGRVTRRYTAKGYQDYHYDVNGRLAKKIVHTRGFRPREWRYLWSGDQLIEKTPTYADGTLAVSQQIQWLYQSGEMMKKVACIIIASVIMIRRQGSIFPQIR